MQFVANCMQFLHVQKMHAGNTETACSKMLELPHMHYTKTNVDGAYKNRVFSAHAVFMNCMQFLHEKTA